MTDTHPPDHPGDETYTAVSSPDAAAADHPVELPIGIVLRQLRGERSLRAVQKGSGVSNTYLCNLEQGIQRPGFRILDRLADYYGVSMSDLFRRAEMLREHGEEYQRAHDADVERSYRFLMDDPYLEQYDKPTATLPLEAKKFMIRLYEHYTGRQLLSDEAWSQHHTRTQEA